MTVRQIITRWPASALKAVVRKVNTAKMQTHGSAPADLATAITAALDWWRDAGVDCDFLDAPQDWLVDPSRKAPAKPAAAAPVVEAGPAPLAGGPAAWPTTLEDFAPWWAAEPDLAPADLPRPVPQGPRGAPLMVVVPMPEAGDHDRLLSGPAGKLLDAMLGAIGLDRTRIYLASALPARIGAPDWAALHTRGHGALLAHHVTLAAPERVILFGQNSISALLGHAPTNTPPDLRLINHDGASIAALAAYDLEAILARPGFKGGVWARMLDFMAG